MILIHKLAGGCNSKFGSFGWGGGVLCFTFILATTKRSLGLMRMCRAIILP